MSKERTDWRMRKSTKGGITRKIIHNPSLVWREKYFFVRIDLSGVSLHFRKREVDSLLTVITHVTTVIDGQWMKKRKTGGTFSPKIIFVSIQESLPLKHGETWPSCYVVPLSGYSFLHSLWHDDGFLRTSLSNWSKVVVWYSCHGSCRDNDMVTMPIIIT